MDVAVDAILAYWQRGVAAAGVFMCKHFVEIAATNKIDSESCVSVVHECCIW
jgi:hypothetical protein